MNKRNWITWSLASVFSMGATGCTLSTSDNYLLRARLDSKGLVGGLAGSFFNTTPSSEVLDRAQQYRAQRDAYAIAGKGQEIVDQVKYDNGGFEDGAGNTRYNTKYIGAPEWPKRELMAEVSEDGVVTFNQAFGDYSVDISFERGEPMR